MKWEDLKLKVGREVFTQFQRGDSGIGALVLEDLAFSNFEAAKGLRCGEILTKYADQVYKRIMEWDIRSVGKLRDLFGWAFPPSLRSGRLNAYMADNEKCDWVVEKNS